METDVYMEKFKGEHYCVKSVKIVCQICLNEPREDKDYEPLEKETRRYEYHAILHQVRAGEAAAGGAIAIWRLYQRSKENPQVLQAAHSFRGRRRAVQMRD